MPRKTKRGGSCSVFGKANKSEKTFKITKLLDDLPQDVSNKILILLKKDQTVISEKLKVLKLEELEKQYTENDESLMNEISQEKLPEKKVSKYIDVRRKQLEKVKDPMIYSPQEINILMEELNKLEKVLNATPISGTPTSAKNATAKSVNAKNVNAKNVTAKNASATKPSVTAKNTNMVTNSSGKKMPLTNVASLISQTVKPATANETPPKSRNIE
jgi:hypothetical protein